MIYEVLAGGIYKIPFPFTDLSGKKARPALALTPPDKNGLEGTLMKQKVIREIVRIDENHQLHIDVPMDIGDEDRFNLAAYAAVINEDPEDDALWEQYTHA